MTHPILVFGELELAELVREGAPLPDHLISIGNPPSPFKSEHGNRVRPEFKRAFKRILRLAFNDANERVQSAGRLFFRLPTIHDAQRVVAFWRRTRDGADGYVVHCWAGVARSTATALALLYLETGSEAEAARRLRKIRPQATPNMRLVQCFDQVLGSSLEAAAVGIILDKAAEMAAELDALVEELPSGDDDEPA